MNYIILPPRWKEMTPQERGVFVTDLMESKNAIHSDDYIIALIKHGVDTTVAGACGNPMLVNAARCRGPTVLQAILEQPGADINIANPDGETAFIMATALGKLDNMKCLSARNARVDAQSDSGETALNVFVSILYRGNLPESAQNFGTDNILRHLLFDAKCDPNIADKDGRAPLDTCALLKDGLKTKWMLEAGADPATQALKMAYLAGDKETIALIQAAYDNSLAVLRAKALQTATAGAATPIDPVTVNINPHKKRIRLEM
jgi:ankyrin repeat protein